MDSPGFGFELPIRRPASRKFRDSERRGPPQLDSPLPRISPIPSGSFPALLVFLRLAQIGRAHV